MISEINIVTSKNFILDIKNEHCYYSNSIVDIKNDISTSKNSDISN